MSRLDKSTFQFGARFATPDASCHWLVSDARRREWFLYRGQDVPGAPVVNAILDFKPAKARARRVPTPALRTVDLAGAGERPTCERRNTISPRPFPFSRRPLHQLGQAHRYLEIGNAIRLGRRQLAGADIGLDG